FGRIMEAIQFIPRDDLEFRLEVLKTIHRIFKAHQSTRDIFRRVGGYVSLVSMIVALEGAFEKPERFFNETVNDLDSVRVKIVAVLQTIFSVLAQSMHNHEVNKNYFMRDVGYVSLENAITLTGALNKNCIPNQVFGILFAFAIDDESIYDLFIDNNTQNEAEGESMTTMTLDYFRRLELVLKAPSVRLVNSEVTPTILHLQKFISSDDSQLSRAILCALNALAQASRRNQVKMNRSGLILELLKRAFSQDTEDAEPTPEKEMMIQIVKKLMSMGVSFEELQYMFKRFDVQSESYDLKSPPGLMDLILQGASRSRWPNFIQFDMGLNQCTSVEIPQLTNFPPANPGYTFLAWVHIERQDNTSNLLLFSVWDDRTLVFRIYVDAKSKMLHVYNAYSKQDIVFGSFEFHVGFWYHLAIVHHKSRLSIKSSTMTLYKEAINLYFNLGARYKSLFQDSLRQFQTYEAATSLFLALRSMSKPQRRESAQQLTTAIKNAAIQSIPESKIIFAFFASNTLSEGTRTGLTLTGVSDATAITIAAEVDCSRLILNSAIPKLDTAVYMPTNMGYLVGEPIVASPFGLDESIWKIGGCAIALKLIEKSQTVESLSKSTAILFEIIRYSWRNSEDMERCHGYEILAYLLKQKRELITVELFELLLTFIGKNPQSPEDSVINNPLAYRFVILNFEIWKKTSIPVQRAQLDQFILFLNTSKMRNFNSRRLPKIHLVKKVLLAFRMNIYAKELIPHLVDSLKAIMLSNWNTESIRAVATFLASTVSKGNMFITRGLILHKS
ncbi:uncharacterized protein EV154DRAFT_423778, partial [Mucor mucedo]|uniref:uncharacterized protein n=1 Tax=Mucor mucedo TaxID=29922 RepID=UPI0022207DBA